MLSKGPAEIPQGFILITGMAKRYSPEPDDSLRENARHLIPAMFRTMMSHKAKVVSHEGSPEELHAMRIAGRPLRYVMESIRPAFRKGFRSCLKEVKDFLDIAGEVHDSDVMIGLMEKYLDEMKDEFTRQSPPESMFSLRGISQALRAEKEIREKKFRQLCRVMTSWDEQKFKKILVKALQ